MMSNCLYGVLNAIGSLKKYKKKKAQLVFKHMAVYTLLIIMDFKKYKINS